MAMIKEVYLNMRIDRLTKKIIQLNAKKNRLSISDYIRNLVYLDISRDDYDEAVEILREEGEYINEE